jgi:ArsR family transcriptional regulator, arsenate/arsenite/antimonite-responsive transcriptional repressor / arsenate reductase (thioredoxin)
MDSPPALDLAPPDFLRLAGHPLRWALLRELSRSDRQVHELTALLGQPQNLVSYHLGKLRSGELVSARRSSADARDAYYTADLPRLAGLLAATGHALHPGLRLAPAPGAPARPPGVAAARVLFLCTGNSSRSQIAEALARDRSGGYIQACSAGSRPKPLHPDAVRVMAARGLSLAGHRPKHLAAFAGQRFDYVVTLCDKVREACPEFPGHPEHIHWSIPDPAATGDGDGDAFERTAADLDTRITFLITAIQATATSAPEGTNDNP